MDVDLYYIRKSPRIRDGIPVFSIMRDEKYFLPFFLNHYRRLGVTSFIIYADHCDEHFLAMLEASDDVSIISAKGVSYRTEVSIGTDGTPKRWSSFIKEFVSNHLLKERWHAVLDADEFLMLPPDFYTVKQFNNFLDTKNRNYAFAPMIDFYPKTLFLRNFERGLNPFIGAKYFDIGPYHTFDTEKRVLKGTNTGVRWRLARRLADECPTELISIYGSTRVTTAKSHKIPLLKTGDRQKRVGDHDVASFGGMQFGCALAHFKFYPELDEKIERAIREGQYYKRSMEYRFLSLAVNRLASVDLVSETTREFGSTDDLLAARAF